MVNLKPGNMKTLKLSSLLFVTVTILVNTLFISITVAQSSDGPFGDLVGKEIRSDNIFLLWQENEGQGDGMQSYQKIYRFDPSEQNFEDRIKIAAQKRIEGRKVRGDQQMTVASGRFSKSIYENIIAAWHGENNSIELMIPQFDTTDVMWNEQSEITVAGVANSRNFSDGRIFLETGDIDGDELDEFLLVYEDTDNFIRIEVYEVDESLTPQLTASNYEIEVEEPMLSSPLINSEFKTNPFDVTVGDLNNDGQDEIILATYNADNTINFHVFEYLDDNSLVQSEPHNIGPVPFNYDTRVPMELQFRLEAGHFREGNSDDLAFIWAYFESEGPLSGNPQWEDAFLEAELFLFAPGNELGEFEKSNNQNEFSYYWNAVLYGGFDGSVDMVTGDLTGGGVDDLAISLQGKLQAYSISDLLDFNDLFSGNQGSEYGDQHPSYDYLAIADMNQNERGELIATTILDSNDGEGFLTNIFSINDDGDREVIGRFLVDEPVGSGDGNRRYAIAAGNFDGYAFTIGEPIHYVDRDNVQPLVIMNAPPVHFDVFDNTIYDLNQCYSGDNCDFTSIYEEIETSSSEVSTEIKSDYGFSIGAGASGSVDTAPMGVGGSVNFEAYFDKTFGKNFSNTETEGETISISVRTEAVEDDRIYATVTEYDVWEYPVYHGEEEHPRRFTMAVEPRDVQSRWYSSKSWNASNYIPNHEVGNILSYPSYDEVSDNPEVGQGVHYFSDTFQLDANTNDSWTLDIESFTTTEADTTYESGYDAKLDAIIRVKRDYTGSEISTHTTTVRDGLTINASLGSIDRSIGENRFDVTPYAYWGRNGALIVDYAVSPERSGAGGSQTWWEEQYGQYPDPAFILPWRYDPEKGFGISEEAKRHQTKDIFFDFDNPEPGDTLTISARIRNFSLVDTSPVTAHFYVGDPDDGGELITGINGETSVTTAESIDAQRFEEVDLQWEVPSGLPSNPRVFAVLNQDSEEEEVHLNNNKGFNILGQSGVSVSNESSVADNQPQTFKLHQSYPNPFNPTTTIGYELPQQTDVKLEVFNILGQRIVTLVNETQTSGIHEVTFDASNLSSGVYLYRITTGQFTKSRKMLLVK